MGGRSTLSTPSCVIFCIIVGPLLFLQSTIFVEGHGYIKSPRARNLVAYEDTIWHPQTANDPEPETCPHCLNRGGSRARCGIAEDTSGIRNYDTPKNALGGIMPTKIQATYTQGTEITIDVKLTAHHKGHFVFSACPISPGEVPTQSCFDKYKLTFVEDLLYNGNYDPKYPERAYIAPISSDSKVPNWGAGSLEGGGMSYSYKMKLPHDLYGDVVLLQWYYLTANSCYHEGYLEYNWPSGWDGTSSMPCGQVSDDGVGVPEQFWNCAEVKIIHDPYVVAPAPPVPAPAPTPPVIQEIESSVAIPVSLPSSTSSSQTTSKLETSSSSSAGSHGKTIVGYYASWQWYDRNKKAAPENMDFTKVQRVNFAFFQIDTQGNMWGTDSWGDPNLLFGPYNWNPQAGDKEYCSWDSANEKVCNSHFYEQGLIHLVHEAGAEIYPSLGGWTLSDPFPAMAASATARATFSQNCVDLIKEYNFDGIDIDWEYPGFIDHSGTAQDRDNFKLLLEDVRAKLDELGTQTGRFYGLTAALPCGPQHIANMDIAHVASTLSELNLMTYDFNGAWSTTTGANAPLYNQGWGEVDFDLHNCVRNWLEGGGTRDKLNIGLPFYGRSFGGATGLNQPHTGADQTKWSLDDGAPQYFNIMEKLPSMTSVWDETTWTEYAYFDNGGFVSYDNEAAICAKVDYAIKHNLNGFIIWELSGDVMDDLSTPLLDITNKKLHNPDLNCGKTGLLPNQGATLPLEQADNTAASQSTPVIYPTQTETTPVTYPTPSTPQGAIQGGATAITYPTPSTQQQTGGMGLPVNGQSASDVQVYTPPTNEQPLVLQCGELNTADSTSLDLSFRYELHRDSSVSVAEVLRELKISMLSGIADQLNCASNSSLSRRNLRSLDALEESQEYVKVIESSQSDLPQNIQCSVPVNLDSAICHSVIGLITVKLEKDASPEILNDVMNELLFYIRTSMAAGIYESSNVRKVIYVENLSVDPLEASINANVVWQPQSAGGNSSLIVAIILSMIVIILLGVLFFVLVRKKSRRRETTHLIEEHTLENTNLDCSGQSRSIITPSDIEESWKRALNTDRTWRDAIKNSVQNKNVESNPSHTNLSDIEKSWKKALNTDETWKKALSAYTGKSATNIIDTDDEEARPSMLEPDLDEMIAEMGNSGEKPSPSSTPLESSDRDGEENRLEPQVDAQGEALQDQLEEIELLAQRQKQTSDTDKKDNKKN